MFISIPAAGQAFGCLGIRLTAFLSLDKNSYFDARCILKYAAT